MAIEEIFKSKAFDDFFNSLKQEIYASTQNDESDLFQEDAFTVVFGDYLVELQELVEQITPTPIKKMGFKINGYCLHDELHQIDLFVSSFKNAEGIETLSRTEVQKLMKWGKTFFEKSLEGLYQKLEESSPAFDLAQQIYALRKDLEQVRIYILSDSHAKKPEAIQAETTNNIQISYHMWDILRLYQAYTSGMKREIIEIPLNEEAYPPIPCLDTAEQDDAEYNSYLAIIPGKTLVNIYATYGPRLLERNVRSFLQARGKINKGIRDTILDNPQRFFAYNNGISATAEQIKIEEINGQPHITWIRDLQIVNGGQTTASLYQAFVKNRKDVQIEKIFVQAKVTVIKDSKKMDEIVPLISKYANSQNKVNMADLSSNHAFHRQLEEISRTMWAPAVGGSQQQTRWFYERARGQYNDERNRAGTTKTAQANFELMNPKRQMLTKTDLTKYEHTWAQLPHEVSKGAEKNFNEFMVTLGKMPNFKIDDDYFVSLIAKSILFKACDTIVRLAQKNEVYGGGYKANVVTYTIAWLSNHLAQRLNLLKIWQNQALSDNLSRSLENISKAVYEHITQPPGAQNITEWCKKKQCWEHLLSKDIQPTLKFEDGDLLDVKNSSPSKKKAAVLTDTKLSDEDEELIKKIAAEGSDYWFSMSSWAAETGNLKVWQRGIAFSLGKFINQGRSPSIKQARQAQKMKEESEALGFKPE